jgi:hypothetical protein
VKSIVALTTFSIMLVGSSDPPAHAAAWHLQVEALTDLPMNLGAKVIAEGPGRLRLSTSLGYLPGPYVDLVNAIVVGLGGYDQKTADLIRAALGSSLLSRTHLGWRPFATYGFYFEVGYGLVALGGGLSREEILSAVTGRSAPQGEPGSTRTYNVRSTLHMIDVELGWQWLFFGDRLTLRAALGFAGTLGSATSISPSYAPRAPNLVREFTRAGEAYLDGIYTSYVFTPVVTVALGYRFF